MLKAVCSLLVFAALVPAAPCFAQVSRDGRLVVTVVDQTGGVLPGATVTIAGLEDANKAAAIAPVAASEQGVATFTGLRPGEKLSEELISDDEEITSTYHDSIDVVRAARSNSLPEGLRETSAATPWWVRR